jgi:hypothetical protein
MGSCRNLRQLALRADRLKLLQLNCSLLSSKHPASAAKRLSFIVAGLGVLFSEDYEEQVILSLTPRPLKESNLQS